MTPIDITVSCPDCEVKLITVSVFPAYRYLKRLYWDTVNKHVKEGKCPKHPQTVSQ